MPSRWVVGDGRSFIGRKTTGLPGAASYWQTTNVFDLAWRFDSLDAAWQARREHRESGGHGETALYDFALWEVNS